jgi:putative lipoic acid-binding regulatory protein
MKVEFEYIGDHLHLKYPCQWVYKIIGFNAGKIRNAISETISGENYRINFSNFSPNGKYICLNLEMVVDSEAQRTEIFQSLKRHADIKMVL